MGTQNKCLVRDTIDTYAGHQQPLLSVAKRRTRVWFGYATRYDNVSKVWACNTSRTSQRFGHATRHNNLSKVILQWTTEGGRRKGRWRKYWDDKIKERAGYAISVFVCFPRDRNTCLCSAVIANVSIVTPRPLMTGVMGYVNSGWMICVFNNSHCHY